MEIGEHVLVLHYQYYHHGHLQANQRYLFIESKYNHYIGLYTHTLLEYMYGQTSLSRFCLSSTLSVSPHTVLIGGHGSYLQS